MNRRPLSILLIVLIAAQSSLSGLVLCSNGGCCHAETEVVQVASGCSHGDHDHGHGHDHSAFVTATSEPHPCDCTDQELDPGDAIPGKRDQAPTLLASPFMFVSPAHLDSSIGAPARTQPPQSRSSAADRQRLAVVRCTRLLL